CRERDLGNWATEKYVVSEPIFDEDDEELSELPKPDDANH
ncbi:MAG: DNA gyrase inhibitor YacG, partial [Acidobacteria bacterium]